jgi:hypothetical protein
MKVNESGKKFDNLQGLALEHITAIEVMLSQLDIGGYKHTT